MVKKSTRKTLKKSGGASLPNLPNSPRAIRLPESPRPEPEIKACVEALKELLPNQQDYAGLVISRDPTINHTINNYTKFFEYNVATASELSADECVALTNLCEKIKAGKLIIKPSIGELDKDLLKSKPAQIAYFDLNKNLVITRERFFLNFKRKLAPN